MTTAAFIRDAIYQRLTLPGHGYTKTRKTPVPQLQPNQLPALSVFVLAGRAESDGADNVGEPRLRWNDTIGISIARGFTDPVVLEGQLDAEVDSIGDKLLTDPTFVHFITTMPKVGAQAWAVGVPIYWDLAAKLATAVSAAGKVLMGSARSAAANPSNHGVVDPLFEACTGVNRRWVFPEQGETYFAEMRLEMSFRTRLTYPPVIVDELERIYVTTAFPVGGTSQQVADTQQVKAQYVIETE